MAAGFVHGVLNTDNINITGESFDYGPWRFLPRNDPAFTAAYFDQTGLYSFGRQPEAAFWNLQQLAACLTLVTGSDGLVAALNSFDAAYRDALRAAVLARLGVASVDEAADVALVSTLFRAMAQAGDAVRWEPVFFDWFAGDAARALESIRGEAYASEGFTAFRDLLAAHAPVRPERLSAAYFQRPEPEELLIEEVETLWAPIADSDDWAPLQAKLARIEAMRAAFL